MLLRLLPVNKPLSMRVCEPFGHDLSTPGAPVGWPVHPGCATDARNSPRNFKKQGSKLERGRGVTERAGNGSETFSALLSTFLTISNKDLYSKISENLSICLNESESLSELFGPLPLCPLPFYLSTSKHTSFSAATNPRHLP